MESGDSGQGWEYSDHGVDGGRQGRTDDSASNYARVYVGCSLSLVWFFLFRGEPCSLTRPFAFSLSSPSRRFSSEIQPAFSHAYQYVRGLKLGIIKVNPAVAERMDRDPLRITLHPRFLPMVVKPKPWLSWNSGSYLVHSSTLVCSCWFLWFLVFVADAACVLSSNQLKSCAQRTRTSNCCTFAKRRKPTRSTTSLPASTFSGASHGRSTDPCLTSCRPCGTAARRSATFRPGTRSRDRSRRTSRRMSRRTRGPRIRIGIESARRCRSVGRRTRIDATSTTSLRLRELCVPVPRRPRRRRWVRTFR